MTPRHIEVASLSETAPTPPKRLVRNYDTDYTVFGHYAFATVTYPSRPSHHQHVLSPTLSLSNRFSVLTTQDSPCQSHSPCPPSLNGAKQNCTPTVSLTLSRSPSHRRILPRTPLSFLTLHALHTAAVNSDCHTATSLVSRSPSPHHPELVLLQRAYGNIQSTQFYARNRPQSPSPFPSVSPVPSLASTLSSDRHSAVTPPGPRKRRLCNAENRPRQRPRTEPTLHVPKTLAIGTLNIRHLTGGSPTEVNMVKLDLLIAHCCKRGLHAVLLQETHLTTTEQYSTLRHNGWLLAYVAAHPVQHQTRNTVLTKYRGGVAILLSPALASQISTISSPSPNILSLDVLTKRGILTMVSLYVPAQAKSAERNALLRLLSTHIDPKIKRGLTLVGGDFNHSITRDKHVTLDIPSLRRLIPVDKLPTWQDTNGHSSVIDHMFANSLLERRHCYTATLSLGAFTDHFAVVSRFRLPTRRPPRVNHNPPLDYSVLHKDDTILEAMDRAIAHAQPRVGISYEDLTKTILAAATQHLPVKKKEGFTKPCNDPRAQEAYKGLHIFHSQEDAATLYRRMVKTTKDVRNEDVHRLAATFDKLVKSDGLKAFEAINVLRKRKRPHGCIAGPTAAARLQAIQAHCAQQLQNPIKDDTIAFADHPDIDPNAYLTTPFTGDELSSALAAMSNNRAPGPDKMTTELLKISSVREHLLSIFNRCLETGTTPEAFRQTIMSMIPKSGTDLKLPAGWRYIALMSATAKLYDRLLLDRLASVIDPHLSHSQNGFRKNRSTIHHVMALRLLTEEITKRGGQACITYVDFSNAFPSVSWTSIRAALISLRVPQKLIDAVFSVYNNHTIRVATADGLTEPFHPTAGVLQGDTLAPYLFVIVLNAVLRLSRNLYLGFKLFPPAGSSLPVVTINELAFADDIALLSPTTAAASQALQLLADTARRVGLLINIKKTQYQLIGTHENPPPVILNGQPLELVNSYRYLGVWTNVRQDLAFRTKEAWEAHTSLSHIWRSSNVTVPNKIHLWRTLVCPILLYGAPAYPLNTKIVNHIRGTFTRMLRIIHGKGYGEHASLEQLYGTTIAPPSDAPYSESLDIPQSIAQLLTLQLNAITKELVPHQPLFDILMWLSPPKSQEFKYDGSLRGTIETHASCSIQQLLAMRASPKELTAHIYKRAVQVDRDVYACRTMRHRTHAMHVKIDSIIEKEKSRLQWELVPIKVQPWTVLRFLPTYKAKLALLKKTLPKNHQVHQLILPKQDSSLDLSLAYPHPSATIIYTDGSHTPAVEGSPAKAGFGCYYGSPTDQRNIACASPGDTINQCELLSIVTCLRRHPHEHLTVFSDSQYCVGLSETIFQKKYLRLLRRGTRNNALWNEFVNLWTQRAHHALHTCITKVKSHAGFTGNECADVLANAGADGIPASNPAVIADLNKWHSLPHKLPRIPRNIRPIWLFSSSATSQPSSSATSPALPSLAQSPMPSPVLSSLGSTHTLYLDVPSFSLSISSDSGSIHLDVPPLPTDTPPPR